MKLCTSPRNFRPFSAPRLALAAIVLLGASTLLTACGKETGSEPKVDNPKPTSNTEAPAVASTPAAKLTSSDLKTVTKASKPYKIVLIVKTLNNPFFKPMVEAFKKTCTELGVTGEVQAAPQETDVDKQAALVQNAASQGFNAICITPADSKALVLALKAAADKGIAIINVDNRLDAAALKSAGVVPAGYVGADNEAGGKLAGEALCKALGDKGNAVVIEGIRGVDNAEARKRGFEAAVQGKLKIVDSQSADWKTEKAQAVMANIIAAHPDINGVFCANDEMAIGAINALKSAGKAGKTLVVSYDNIKEVQSYLASGELIGTVEQHPDSMGENAVRLAVGVLDKSVKPGGELLVDLSVITGKK
jgi:ribose transport system substrate-binding protein